MENLNLPLELLAFVRAGGQLEYDAAQCEAGPAVMRAADELRLERLPVEVYGKPFSSEDPHDGEAGFYYVLAVPLTKGDWVTYAALLWLPQEKLFGTYEDSHHDLLTFPAAGWADIAADPLLYLNAHWDPEAVATAQLKPWPAHPFGPGLTFADIERHSQP